MKNRVELIFDDNDNKEVKKEIGYVRLLICILGGRCDIEIKKHRKPGKSKKISLDKQAYSENLMV